MLDQLDSALLPHFSTHRVEALSLIVVKVTIIYLFLILALRLMGKRELGQMNIYDLVLIIVLANSVQNAMVGDDNTLAGGLVAATTLLVLNRIFTLAVARSPKLEKLMVGSPIVIAHDGHLVDAAMKGEGVTREQVQAALREHGMDSLDEARLCVLEVDGTISIVPKDARMMRTRRHFRQLRLQ